MSLRLIPNLQLFRPCDAVETAECWALALARADGPSVLALTRQNLPQLRTEAVAENLSARGAYRLRGATADRRVILIATGSEVEVAMDVADKLETEGVGADVVSMPSWELFAEQDAAYRDDILPMGDTSLLRVSIEAGSTLGWEQHTMVQGLRFGMDGFGASAPIADLYEHFGLTAAKIAPRVLAALKGVTE